MRKFYKNKLFILFVSIVLMVIGIFASLSFKPYPSLSILTVRENISNLKFTNTNKLFKGDELVGTFKAKENNLGIVFLKFDNYVKPDYAKEDNLIFRIKETDSKTWYVVNHYKSGIIVGNLFFPFGFPIIRNSKGKTYTFEVRSLNGNQENAVAVDTYGLSFASGYKFSRNEIMASNTNITNFLTKKFIYSYENIYFILSSLLYFLPAFFYILWNTVLNRYINYKYWLGTLSLFLLFIDVSFLRDMYSGVLFGILGLWLLSVLIYKLDEEISFSLFFILVILSTLLIQMHSENLYLINKLSVWAYFFLLIGITEKIYLYNKKIKTTGLKEFLKGNFKFI